MRHVSIELKATGYMGNAICCVSHVGLSVAVSKQQLLGLHGGQKHIYPRRDRLVNI